MPNSRRNNVGDGYYRTRDLYYAAFLVTCKVTLKRTEEEGKRIVFVFEPLDGQQNIGELEMAWFGRSGQVVAPDYADNLRNLKTLCYQQQGERARRSLD